MINPSWLVAAFEADGLELLAGSSLADDTATLLCELLWCELLEVAVDDGQLTSSGLEHVTAFGADGHGGWQGGEALRANADRKGVAGSPLSLGPSFKGPLAWIGRQAMAEAVADVVVDDRAVVD